MNKLSFSIESQYGATIGTSGGATLGDLITNVLGAGIAIAGVISVILFLYGALQIIQAAGSDDPKKQAQGQQTFTYAIIGFIVTFSSYWIIRLIEELLRSRFVTGGPPGF